MTLDISALREFVRSNLNAADAGRVLLDALDFPPVTGEGDAERCSRFLLEQFEIEFPSSRILPVLRADAVFIAARLLSRSPWYPQKNPIDGQQRVAAVCRLFDDDVRMFSTLKFDIDRSSGNTFASGRGLLHASMEMGLLALDSRRVGILWIGDED